MCSSMQSMSKNSDFPVLARYVDKMHLGKNCSLDVPMFSQQFPNGPCVRNSYDYLALPINMPKPYLETLGIPGYGIFVMQLWCIN